MRESCKYFTISVNLVKVYNIRDVGFLINFVYIHLNRTSKCEFCKCCLFNGVFTKSDHFGHFIPKPDHFGVILQNRITAVQ